MYAVNCGSWYQGVVSEAEAIALAGEIIASFDADCHPWGDLKPHQIIQELAPNEGVNSYGEIDTFPF